MALAEYFVEHTPFLERFVHSGATHAKLLEQMPIYLVSDARVAVRGALALASEKQLPGSQPQV